MNKEFIEALKAHLLQYARRFWPQDLVDAVECVNDHIDVFAASWRPAPQNNEVFGAEGAPCISKIHRAT